MSDIEDVPTLRALLARASDDRERSDLHDALAIRLALDRRFEEAVEESRRAVALHEKLAERDPGVRRRLAVSLNNEGGALTFLGRTAEAVRAYARSFEISAQHQALTAEDAARAGYSAGRLAELLGSLGYVSLAAKFRGAALGLYLVPTPDFADVIDNGRARQLALLLFLSLGGASADRDTSAITDIDVDALASIVSFASAAAAFLGRWARSRFEGGDVRQALAIAQRAVGYCQMFRHNGDDAGLTSTLASSRQTLAELLTDGRPHRVSVVRDRPQGLDRRLWSCSATQFSALVGDLLDSGLSTSDVHTLAAAMRSFGLYPARDLDYRCDARLPNVFITYTWTDNYVDLQVAIRSAFNYLGTLVREARPDLDHDLVEELVNEKLGAWVDFVFIDQSARDVVQEVQEVLPRVLEAADVHFVLSDTALERSWCCYELALFNVGQEAGAASMRTFVGRNRLNYRGFAATASYDPTDKLAIERSILERYPDGIAGFDLFMIQAAMLSDPFVAKGFAQTSAAIDRVGASLDKWLTL